MPLKKEEAMRLSASKFRDSFGLMLVGALAAFAVATSTPVQAQSLQEKIKKNQPVVVATEDDYRPFEFMQDGKPAGLDNELFQIMKSEAKFELRQEILPWTGLLAGVSTGKYDAAVTGALVNKERANAFDFAMPVAENTHYYLKRKNDNRIKEVKDLADKSVGVQAGSVLLARLPELEAMLAKTGGKLGKVVQYTSYPEAYQDLATGRLDYIVNGQINLLAIVAEKPGVFEIGQPVSGPSYVAWPVKKGNKEMLDYLNGFLKKMRESGKLAELQQKWLKVTFKDLPERVEPTF
jgi:polar amino acid transport system substrate-binding protein